MALVLQRIYFQGIILRNCLSLHYLLSYSLFPDQIPLHYPFNLFSIFGAVFYQIFNNNILNEAKLRVSYHKDALDDKSLCNEKKALALRLLMPCI